MPICPRYRGGTVGVPDLPLCPPQVQVWHRQTGRLISRLGSEAAAVAERLERSGSVQEDILQAQERALGNQEQLMDQGRRMSQDVDSWRENLQLMVQDFR